MDEVQGSMVTAEWPLGVLTYTSESTVSCGIQTVMRTSPLHVLLQVDDTSGPWMAGGVVRVLQFLYTFPWAMLQNILYQYYLTFGFIKLGFCALDFKVIKLYKEIIEISIIFTHSTLPNLKSVANCLYTIFLKEYIEILIYSWPNVVTFTMGKVEWVKII